MKFENALKFVLSYEGGYVNDPNDPGGETNLGISKRAYPNEDIKALTKEKAAEIYRRDYWDSCKCNELPESMAIAVFDCAVNQGVKTASRLLQIAVGATVDGVIGPKTVLAAFKGGQKALILFLLQRAKSYMQIKNVAVWGANWGERLVRLAEIVIEDDDKKAWI